MTNVVQLLAQCAPLCLLFAALPLPAAEKFAGTWERCARLSSTGEEVCAYAVLGQRGNRVCGIYTDRASAYIYETRFMAQVRGNTLVWTAMCGRPGGSVRSWCPSQRVELSDEIQSKMKQVVPEGIDYSEDPVGWHETRERSLLCGKFFYQWGFATCSEARKSKVQPMTKRPRNLRLAREDQRWLEDCRDGRPEAVGRTMHSIMP